MSFWHCDTCNSDNSPNVMICLCGVVKPSKVKKPSQQSILEETFAKAWLNKHPDMPFIRQYKFDTLEQAQVRQDYQAIVSRKKLTKGTVSYEIVARRWPVDFAFPEHKLAIEIQGGGFVNGGHNRGMGMTNDAEKANALMLIGWRLLYFTTKHFNPPPKKRAFTLADKSIDYCIRMTELALGVTP